MVKTARLDDAFSEMFKLETSPADVQSRLQKDKKRRKGKAKKNLKERKAQRRDFDFCAYPSKNVAHRGASGKKGILSCRLKMPF